MILIYIISSINIMDNVIIIDGKLDNKCYKKFIKQYNYLTHKGKDLNKPIVIIIQSEGGDLIVSVQIINTMLRHNGLISCYIHKYAHSGATAIALASNIIYMKPTSTLSPINIIHKIDGLEVENDIQFAKEFEKLY